MKHFLILQRVRNCKILTGLLTDWHCVKTLTNCALSAKSIKLVTDIP